MEETGEKQNSRAHGRKKDGSNLSKSDRKETETKTADFPEAVAIIPARGGSKGLPRKNVKPLLGRPLIAYAVEAARAARAVRRTIVSTDDEEIARTAAEYGAEIVRRPAELAGDEASSEAALLHALDQLRAGEDRRPELTVFMQCTSPLTLPEDVDGTVRALLEEGADTAFSAVPFHHFIWRRAAGGDAVGVNHNKRERRRRQDREPEYLENGAVYVMRTAGFLRARHRFFGKTTVFEMPVERCLEIDEQADFTAAEQKLAARRRAAARSELPEAVQAVILDFDGVLTDNRVVISEDGREAVFCERSDGLGLARLRRAGVPVWVISSEENPVVARRCEKLGLECFLGVGDKETLLRRLLEEKGLDATAAVYVGNDVNDAACMRLVGCAVAPADARPEALGAADLVLSTSGGRGAVRELCDLILE